MDENETCPDCGHAVSVTYGPDYRFDPPCTRPRMWTACCGGQCLDDSKSWTSFTRERALELWNNGIRKLRFDALPAKVRADLTENADYLAG